MDIYVKETRIEERALLEQDKLSYAVLFNILGGPLKKIITDHKNILIAHSVAAFPTWIWAPDGAEEAILDEIFKTIKAEFSPIENYRFNTKYEIAQYLIARFWREEQKELRIDTNIAAYECITPRAPKKQVDGHLECIPEDEVELAARLICEASVAIGDRILSEEESEQAAKEQLKRQCLYIWRDKDGRPVSFCDKNEDEHYVKVSQVYTIPEARGKNYAGRMIYEICEDIVANGQIPMLYADADYVPSNRCYQNIGFELKGKIVTIKA